MYGGGYDDLGFSGKGRFSHKRTCNVDRMSRCASFLCLNGLFESSFFRAEHLTASDKYKFSGQECVIREVCFAKTTKIRKCLVRQSVGTTGNSFPASDEGLEPAEIVAVLCTCYRVFFENSQMFGATKHWNDGKFVHSEQQGVGTDGNFLSVSNKALEPVEIRSPRTTEHWSLRKFFPRERRYAETGGNSLPASNEAL